MLTVITIIMFILGVSLIGRGFWSGRCESSERYNPVLYLLGGSVPTAFSLLLALVVWVRS